MHAIWQELNFALLCLLLQTGIVFSYAASLTNEKIANVTTDLLCSRRAENSNVNSKSHDNRQRELNDNESNESTTRADDLILAVNANKIECNSTNAFQQIELYTSDEQLEQEWKHIPEPFERLLITPLETTIPVTPINMSDFLVLIPAARVQTILQKYYQYDAEVQQAYRYLQSQEFQQLQQQLMQSVEMQQFLQFLNNNGMNLINLLYELGNLTKIVASSSNNDVIYSTDASVNDIYLTTSALEDGSGEGLPAEQLNGLHGLIDSILDVLPQDELLTNFFDKLENDVQFSHLANNFGTPKFATILSNLQQSEPLGNLIFTLHNNGIYITRIVDSLRAYFFLGSQ